MEIQIEKNVPIPKAGAGRKPKYPFEKMEVGDSFFAKVNGHKSAFTLQNSLLGVGRKFLKENKKGWVLQSAVEGDGVRIWRTK